MKKCTAPGKPYAERAAEAQAEYCVLHELPQFAPLNGLCPDCGRSIYHTYGGSRGVSAKDAARTLITGCPHCGATFCE